MSGGPYKSGGVEKCLTKNKRGMVLIRDLKVQEMGKMELVAAKGLVIKYKPDRVEFHSSILQPHAKNQG